MSLFAASDVAVNNDWKVSVNVEPVLEFFDKAKHYFTTYVMEFTSVHWYILACWMLSFFIVPVKFRSLGAVVISPIWLPFWLAARLLTSVLAVKRANNTLAMSDHYASSTAKVEAVSSVLQTAADRLVGVSANFEKLKAVVNNVDETTAGVKDDLRNVCNMLLKELKDNNKVMRDQAELISSLKDKISLGQNGQEAQKLAKVNAKMLEDQIEMIAKLLENNKADKVDPISAKGEVYYPVKKESEVLCSNKVLESIIKSFTDKSDDYYVALGHTVTKPNGAKTFAYRLGVRLGALRGKEPFNAYRDLYIVDGDKQVESILENGLPVLKKQESFSSRAANYVGPKSSRLLDENTFLKNL